MAEIRVSNESVLGRVREAVVVGLLAILIGTAVYTALGLAWTFKMAVESSQKLRHPFGGGHLIR